RIWLMASFAACASSSSATQCRWNVLPASVSEFRNPHAGLGALLTPQNSVLLLIDHQAFQFANLHSHEPTLVVNNVVGLAKTAKAFGIPTILTTVLEERDGYLIQGLQDVFPDQKPINRTF